MKEIELKFYIPRWINGKLLDEDDNTHSMVFSEDQLNKGWIMIPIFFHHETNGEVDGTHGYIKLRYKAAE